VPVLGHLLIPVSTRWEPVILLLRGRQGIAYNWRHQTAATKHLLFDRRSGKTEAAED